MDVETTIQAFASAGNDLPQDAAEWSLDHWEEAAPGLLGVLERFASGTERSDEAASAVFFILHLAGEKQDPLSPQGREQPSLLRVLQSPSSR